MVTLLGVYDGHPIFNWHGVTLNALVSVLSVSMKAALSYATAECIGQWKWNLFSRGNRPLIDFERIDLASRGPLGSIRVICKTRGSMPVRLGALLVLLAIAVDPFSQQLVQFRQGTEFILRLNHTRAENMRAERYIRGNIIYENDDTISRPHRMAGKASAVVDLSMQGSILGGFSHSLHSIHQQADVRCPTGRCTWPSFKTLGVCHLCYNLTTDLKKVDGFGKVTGPLLMGTDALPMNDSSAFVLPNGHFLANINGCPGDITGMQSCTYSAPDISLTTVTSPTMTSFGSGDPNKTNRMQELDTLIWATSMIYLDPIELRHTSAKWPDVPIRASECAIYYCAQSINSRIDGNTIYENATQDPQVKRDPDSWQPIFTPIDEKYVPENIPPGNKMSSLEWNERYSVIKREDLVLHNPENSSSPKYVLAESAVKSISSYFPSLLTANLTGSPNVTAAIAKKLGEHAVSYNGARMSYSTSEPPALENIYELNEEVDFHGTFAALGASMTNEIRRNGDFERSLYDRPVYGLIGVGTTYYSVEWGWISLHAVVLCGGLLFWMLTVRNSSGCPPWKSSSLAVMNQGRTTGQVLEGSETMRDMERAARGHKVSIVSTSTAVPAMWEHRSGTDAPVGP
ncbi:hypothetical protein PHISCL_05790 [Aspergillus sclerotialis]|uniref:Uncharacterized protein n=1 Tax=Aspergillus sclerotialis TaxID=2070753 RepID=A0A3A2ZFD3_9EURO|nr:hypothetical protein PHISCL_05790 [Aspergillus sclerotialis]